MTQGAEAAHTGAEPGRRRWSRLTTAGLVAGGLFLTVFTLSAVKLGGGLAGPVAQTLTSPARQTPVDADLELVASEYLVFELTGHRSGGGGVTFTESHSPTLTPGAVTVTGPDGRPIAVTGPGAGVQRLTRGRDVYTGAVQFVIDSPGTYRVTISGPQPAQVVIGRSLGSGFGRVARWLAGLAIGGVGLLVSGGLLIAGISRQSRGRKRPPAGPGRPGTAGSGGEPPPASGGPSTGTAGPPPGWFPDPQADGQWRFWDGREWTQHTHAGPGSGPAR